MLVLIWVCQQRDGKGAYVNTDASELEHTIHPEPANAGTEKLGIIVPAPLTLKYSDPDAVGAWNLRQG